MTPPPGLKEGQPSQQPFERYPALASWIERLASTPMGLSLGDWMVFLGALNLAIRQAEALPAPGDTGLGELRTAVENLLDVIPAALRDAEIVGARQHQSDCQLVKDRAGKVRVALSVHAEQSPSPPPGEREGWRPGDAPPKFGDLIENGWASERNPTRCGLFVRAFRRGGKMNPGHTWEMTDGRGKFWEFKPQDIGERLSITRLPAPPLDTAGSGG